MLRDAIRIQFEAIRDVKSVVTAISVCPTPKVAIPFSLRETQLHPPGGCFELLLVLFVSNLSNLSTPIKVTNLELNYSRNRDDLRGKVEICDS